MKYYLQIIIVSVASILPIESIEANVGGKSAQELLVARQGLQQIVQAGSSSNNRDRVKSSGENFKWAINPENQPITPPNPNQYLYSDREYDWWEQPGTKAEAPQKTVSYHRRSNSYATNPDPDPPRYVRQLSEIGVDAFKDVTWLEIGIEHRTRYEMRHNDIRHIEGGYDNPFFLRNRVYLGIKEILDPFRFAVEFQDSRVYNHKFASTDQENNPYDLINGYGELFFKRALGEDGRGQNQPIRFRVGRMAYETLDRRFIGRNEWRNTTNSFEGFRLNLGQQNNPWEVEMFGLQPVKRLQSRFDEANKHLWVFGAIGHWRKWSDIITLQPYYMGQKQTADPNGLTTTSQLDREIHMPSLRGYGKIGNLLDYDLNFSYQFGFNGAQQHNAYGYTTEIGRNFDYAWKPRLSAFYGYATGDRNSNDSVSNRFDRFFGFARPWSADHYVIYENIKAPKIRFDLQPTRKLGIEAGYAWFWLASKTDRLFDSFNGNISVVNDPGYNRDKTGKSGDYVGSALETRIRYQVTPRVNTVVGYTHFTAGNFVKNIITANHANIDQRSGNTDFLYVEVLISAF